MLLPEQPFRSEQKSENKDGIDGHLLQRAREQNFSKRFCDSYNESSKKCSPETSQPTQDNNDKRCDDEDLSNRRADIEERGDYSACSSDTG